MRHTKRLRRASWILCMAVLASCSSDDSKSRNATASQNTVSFQSLAIESEKDLPECAQSSLGMIVYLMDTKHFRICEKDGWQELDLRGEKGEVGPETPSPSHRLREAWRANIRSVAYIEASYGGGICTHPTNRVKVSGTGFIIDKDLLATNAHVVPRQIDDLYPAEQGNLGCATTVAPLDKVELWFPETVSGETDHSNRAADSTVKRLDDQLRTNDDLALLEAPTGNRKPLKISRQDQATNKVDSPGVRLGDEVLLIGFTRGTTFAHFTSGNVSAIQPVTTEFLGGFLADGRIVYQLDVVSGGGSSGGPILNLEGEVISINFAGDVGTSDTQYAYAYRVKVLRDLLKEDRSWFELPESD